MNEILKDTGRLRSDCEGMLEDLTKLRRTLHMHPELGTNEHETDWIILKELDRLGIPYTFPVADTGIAATITGKQSGADSALLSVVGLRADIDALPLTEDPARPYCSQNPGVMHACGHDAHTTIALGAARYLKEHESEWAGTVRIFFQPAEETCGGAERMIAEGCMEQPHVDYMLGLHMMPTHEYGTVEYRYGALNASSDELHIIIHGKSGHCAYPDAAVDAIVAASAVIQSLQSVVSRSLSPFAPVVLSFGKIAGGSAQNIIADEVRIDGTLRTTSPGVRARALDRIRAIVEETSAAYGAKGELLRVPGYDALINNDQIVDLVREVASARLGADHVVAKEQPSLGVEDFSFFLNHAKGAFYHLGCANRKKGITAALHNQNFDIDERVLSLGVELQLTLIGKLLERPIG